MADYKLYFLDDQGVIRMRVDLDCRDDAHAVEIVSEHASQVPMELWEGQRLVKRFDRLP